MPPVTVTDRKAIRDIVLSASQIDTYWLCPRKWAWDKLEGLPRTTHPSAVIGSAMHADLEEYLKNGTIPPPDVALTVQGKYGPRTVYPGMIAQRGLEHLPEPGTGEVERGFEITHMGVRFRGFIDLYRPLAPVLPGPALVLDHKSCGSFKWIKTPDILKTDAQAAIYSAFAFSEGAREVELRWVYYLTTGKGGSRVSSLLLEHPVYADQMMDPVVKSANEMLDLHDRYNSGKLKVLDVESNVEGCAAYGGCPYRDNCNLTPEEKIRGLYAKGKRTMGGLRSMLGADKKSSKPKRERTNKPEKESEESEAVEYDDMSRDDLKALAVKRGLVSKASKAGAKSLRTLLKKADAEPPEGDDEDEGSDDPPDYEDMSTGDLRALIVERELMGEDAAGDAGRGDIIATLEKYPPKVEEPEEETPAEDSSDAESAADGEAGPRCIYVGCVPLGERVTHASEIMDAANELVCKEEGIPHWTAAEYGTGPGMLAQAIGLVLNNYSGHIVVQRGTHALVIDALTKDAYLVVQGV